MSVHIPSTLKVTELNVANTAAIQSLRFRDGGGGSWLLYAAANSTKLLYDSAVVASFELSGSYVNLNLSGCVYSTWTHTDMARAGELTVDGVLTATTINAKTLNVDTLDVSKLDFSDATLSVASITVTGTAEINTLSAIQVLAEQGDIQQLTVDDTLTANNAAMSELTVTHTLVVRTLEARNEVNAPLLSADRAEFDTLYVNGKAITGSSSGGGSGGGEVTVPMHLTVHTVTANETISIPGTQAVNGDIELATDMGIRVGTAGAIEIADEGSDAIVRINNSGIHATNVVAHSMSVSTVSVNSLTSDSSVTTRNLTVGNSGIIDGSLQVTELNVSSSVNAADAAITTATITDLASNTAEVNTLSAVSVLAESIKVDSIQITEAAIVAGTVQGTNITASGSITAPLIDADAIQVDNITTTNNITSSRITTDVVTTDAIRTTGNARVGGAMSVIGRLDTASLYVNGVEITTNGGESELPSTIQVSEVQALSEGAAVSIPQMQGNELRLNGKLDGPSPTGYLPLGLHIRLRRSVGDTAVDIIKTTVTVLSAETEFREPVLFRPELGETQIKSLDSANFEQCTVANTGLYYAPTIDAKASGVLLSPKELAYSERAWVETRPALVNSTSVERAIITLGADRALSLAEGLSEIAETVNGYGSTFLRVDSAAFTLTSESITTRAAFQLPFNSTLLGTISVQNADGSITNPPPASTELLYAAEVKTNVSPSQFDVEATATLATYETITTADLTNYIDNTKARLQLDVSPAAYSSVLSPVEDNPGSGIYVKPNNVIIQAPSTQGTGASYVVPVNPEQMGVGLYGHNIVLDAESAIKLEAATSVVGGDLTVSGLVKANTASVVGSLSAKSLYMNGTEIISGSTGGSDARFTSVTTPTVSSASSLNLMAPGDLTLNGTAGGISLIAGSTNLSYCEARIAIGVGSDVTGKLILDHNEGAKVTIDKHNASTGAGYISGGGTLQLGTLIAGAGETTVIDSSQFNPSGTSGGLKNNKIIIGSSSARIISCMEWNAGDGELLSYLQSNEGRKTCVPMHLLFQIFQLKPELQASTTTT